MFIGYLDIFIGKIFIHSCPYFSLFSYLFVCLFIVVVVNLWNFFIYLLEFEPFLGYLGNIISYSGLLLMVSANK